MSFVPADETTNKESDDDLEIKDEPRIDDHEERERDVVPEKTVTLVWMPKEDDPELPLSLAVEANSQRIAEAPSSDDLEEIEHLVEANNQLIESKPSESDLTLIEQTIMELRNTVTTLQEENRELQGRLKWFENWTDQVTDQLSTISDDMQLLVTVSDLDAQGVCPKCNSAPLQITYPLLGTDRVECTDEECKHAAAELEWT